MGGILSRGLFGFGVLGLVIIGCADRAPAPEQVGTTQQAIFASEQTHTGADLPAKTLALTFDDGPSYRGAGGQTRAISAYLRSKNIKATFFVVGSCIADTNLPTEGCDSPSDDADGTIRQVLADGHNVGNHTTTHREQPSLNDPAATMVDILETDTDLKPYASLIPWNRWFFRAPTGDWSDTLSSAANRKAALNKYVGPIYWTAGGNKSVHDSDPYAADWYCWPNNNYSAKQCGDKYLTEIHTLGNGIVLMHDQEFGSNKSLPATPTATNYAAKPGNTYLMLHYILDALEKEGGWSFTTIDQVPSIKAALQKCDASCGTCSGPAASNCLTCASGKYLSGGTCVACSTCPADKHVGTACAATADTVCLDGAATGGTDGGTADPGQPGGSSSSSGGATSGGGSNGTTTGGGISADGGASDTGSSGGGGCSAAGTASPWNTLALVGLGLLAGRRRRKAA